MSRHVVSAGECMRDKLLVGCSEFPEPGADPDTQYDTEMAAAYSARAGAEQTGRNHVARSSDPRTLCAVEIPTRLWRALGEAGAAPAGLKGANLTEQCWLAEIERPRDNEPNAVALWESGGSETALAIFSAEKTSIGEAQRT